MKYKNDMEYLQIRKKLNKQNKSNILSFLQAS